MSHKRKRGEEPTPVQGVPPNGASMTFDSMQNAGLVLGEGLGETSQSEFFKAGVSTKLRGSDLLTPPQRMASVYPPQFPFPASLPIPYTPAAVSKYDILSNGDGTPGQYENRQESAGNFMARINPLSGCNETTYFGSYTGNAEWDTHKGNSILSFRAFIEPFPGKPGGYYIFDFFVKVPDGIVFDGTDPLNERLSIMNCLNDLLLQRSFPSGVGPYDQGFAQWNQDTAGAFTKPTGNPNIKQPIITCHLTETGELFFHMDMSSTYWHADYVDGGSTFVLFDHPNSITNRGAGWSGMGFPNPLQTRPFSSQQAVSTSVHGQPYPPTGSAFGGLVPSHTTYPLGGKLVVRNRILLSQYTDSVATPGLMAKATYENIRKATFDQFQFVFNGKRNASGVVAQDWTVGISIFNGNSRNTLGSWGRPPGLKDSRYWIHNSDEISFDRKFIPFADRILKCGGRLGPTTFGVDFRDFSAPSAATAGMNGGGNKPSFTTKPWGESTYDGVRHNPNIHLAQRTSQMFVAIQTYNEHGEPLLVTGQSQVGVPLLRNLMAGEKESTIFKITAPTINDNLLTWNSLTMPNILEEGSGSLAVQSALRYPSLNPIYQFYRIGNRKDFMSGQKSILGDAPTGIDSSLSGPSDSLDETFDFDVLYYDNGARMSAGDTVVHFFQSEMY